MRLKPLEILSSSRKVKRTAAAEFEMVRFYFPRIATINRRTIFLQLILLLSGLISLSEGLHADGGVINLPIGHDRANAIIVAAMNSGRTVRLNPESGVFEISMDRNDNLIRLHGGEQNPFALRQPSPGDIEHYPPGSKVVYTNLNDPYPGPIYGKSLSLKGLGESRVRRDASLLLVSRTKIRCV